MAQDPPKPTLDLRSMTGLEQLQAGMDGLLPAPSIGATMGLALDHLEKGLARFVAQADARHLNPMGGVHGGFAATALDSATGCAVHTALDPGETYGTVHLEVKMLRAVPMRTPLWAEAKLLRRSRNIGFAEGALRDADGVIYAHGSATCAIKQFG
ncbi:MAG: PaaI family thioesterase [Pseudomonadota bacterium]